MSETATPDSAGTRPSAFDRRLLAPMMIGASLNPVNSSIIAVALAPIGLAFGAPASQTAWLVSALYLATAIGQPLVGALVDTFGPKRMFLLGTGLTGIAGVAGVLAPNLWVLVLARVILGFGTCAGYPAAMYLIRSEAKRTNMASPAGVLTILSVTTQTIAVIGPIVGGLLIGVGGWRSTLAVNIPLAAAAFVLGARFLPAHTPLDVDAATKSDGPRVDPGGIAGFCVSLISLLLFLQEPHTGRLWLLAISVLAGTAFAAWEMRHAHPFIDLRVLGGNIPLVMTYVRALTASTVSYSFIYGYTQWLEDGRRLSASEAGLILMPTFAIGILVATLTGRRPEVKSKLLVGAAAQVVVCVLLLGLHSDSAITTLIVVALVLGLPQGLVSLGNQNALYFQANPDTIGASAGLLRTSQYLGAIIASSATGLFFGSSATTPGLHNLALFMTAAAAIFLAMTIADRSLSKVGRDNSSP